MTLPRRRWLIGGTLFAALIAAVATFAIADTMRYVEAPVRIDVEATPITSFNPRDPAQTRFGALEFRGGLVLTSRNPAFGGISAIHMEPDGSHFIAITDRGSWLRGRIVYGGNGKPAGIADAEMAPILGPDGKPLAARNWYDVESLTERDGILTIGIERVEQIVIAVTEHSLDAAGNHRSYLLNGEQVARFSVKRSDDFDVSDCAILQDDLLLFERRFSPARGVAVRIRRLPLASLKEGTLVDGPSLFEADLAYQIDNMEGLGVHRNAHGDTVLTLVSDDNFSVIQRNLLLQFTLVEE
jgi:hypothetical protein